MRIFILLILVVCSVGASAQTIYRSRVSGEWSTGGNWEVSTNGGGSWATAATAPSAANNTGITIQAVHAMTINAGIVTADQIVMNGSLTVGIGGTLTLANGTGDDLTINAPAVATFNGSLNWSNLATVINNGTAVNLLFNAGSNLNYNYTTGNAGVASDLPAATFNSASNLNFNTLSGTITFPATWNASFGNVNFNGTGSSVPVFQGSITSIQGNLTTNGTTQLSLSTNQSYTLTVAGSVSIGGNSRIIFSQSGNVVINLGGDLDYTSVRTTGSYLTFTGTTVLNLTGNFTMDTGVGIFRLAGTGANGTGTINLTGDFTLINGTVSENGSGTAQGTLNFIRAGTQAFFNTGTISNRINYYVSAATTLDLGESPATAGTAALFTVDGTVIVGSTDPLGAIFNGTTNGNIRTPLAGRIWNPGSVVIYGGTGQQFMQAGHPTTSNVTTIINNASNVSLVSAVTVGGPLEIQSGNLDLNDNALTVQNTVAYTGGFLQGTAASSLIISGTLNGSAGSLSFAPGFNTLGTLTINRAGTGVNLDINDPVNLVVALNLITGDITNNSVITVSQGLTVTKYETSALAGSPLTANPGETYNLYYTTATSPTNVSPTNEYPADQSHVGNVTIDLNSNAQDFFIFDRNITVNGTFTLTRGRMNMGGFNMTMNGGTYNDDTGSMIASTGTLFFGGNTNVTGTADPLFICPVVVNTGATVNFLRNFIMQRDLTIQSGATWNMNGFTVLFSSATAQVINANGATFSNINLNKGASSITLTSPLNLAGGLVFVGGTSTDVNSNGNLVLVSSSDAANATQGYIFQVNANNRIVGNVVVNRFITGEGRIYRYISSPVTTTVADLKDDMLVQGNFVDPSPTTVICGFTNTASTKSLFYYNEAATGSSGSGYVSYPLAGTTTAASPLTPGRGYATWLRTCLAPTFLDYTGPINFGAVNAPVTYTNTGNAAADGWNLVGNPYPCAIDWDLLTRANLANAFAITDNGAGTTRYYDPDFGNVDPSLVNGQIAIGQGFWVYANAAAPSLTFTEAAKVTNTPEFFRKGAVPGFIITMSNGAMEDRTYVKTVAGAKTDFEKLDLPKIVNPEGLINVGTLAGNNELAINAVSEIACGMTFPLRTTGIQPGSYTLAIDTRGFFTDYNFVLVDKSLKKEVALNQSSYTFTVGDKDLSPDRFYIRVDENKTFNAVEVLSADACSPEAQINLASSQADVTYSIWNTQGKQVSDLIPGSGSAMTLKMSADALAAGDNELVVKASNACQMPVPVSSFSIVKHVPSIIGVTSNFTCKSGAVELVASADSESVIYNWYESEAAATPIATGNVFETPVLSKNKTYYVEAVSSTTSCISGRKAVTTDITVFTPPVLTVDGSKLVSSYPEGNQWYYEGVLLNKENAQTLKMSKSGLYEVVVTFKGCSFTLNHELNNTALDGIEVYPNPASGFLTISRIPKDVDAIVLTNAVGQNMGTIYKKDQVFDGQVSVASVPDGVYLFVITRGSEKSTYRFVKQAK